MKIISFLEKKHIFQGVQFDVQISVIKKGQPYRNPA